MAKTIIQRIQHAWSVFFDGENAKDPGGGYGYRPTSRRSTGFSNEKSIVASIYTRVAIDVSSLDFRHVDEDANGQYQNDRTSDLQYCLRQEPNIDQDPRSFIRDIILTMFESGVAAIVPVETTLNPIETGGYDVKSLRVGSIIEWRPRHVRVRLYDDRENKGIYTDVLVPKSMTAIIENPFYSVMNEPNSTLQRLIRKLRLLDDVDEASSSGKLDIILQLPYAIKSDLRREQSRLRRQELEEQLMGSKYGIAYIDGTERVTQLNRPVENNLMVQVQYLQGVLYNQLGVSEEVINGTATPEVMVNYHVRTIKPLAAAITLNMRRTFLTKTARSQGQNITYFRDPFEYATLTEIGEVADKLSRNEVLTGNEIRSSLGVKPSKDPGADKLQNKNVNSAPPGSETPKPESPAEKPPVPKAVERKGP